MKHYFVLSGFAVWACCVSLLFSCHVEGSVPPIVCDSSFFCSSTSKTVSNATCSMSDPCSNIETAIEQCREVKLKGNATCCINLQPGFYYQAGMVIEWNDIAIIGKGLNPEDTVVDCSGTISGGPAFVVSENVTQGTFFFNLTFQHCKNRAILIGDSSSTDSIIRSPVVFENVNFIRNSVTLDVSGTIIVVNVGGGAMEVNNRGVSMTSCTIQENVIYVPCIFAQHALDISGTFQGSAITIHCNNFGVTCSSEFNAVTFTKNQIKSQMCEGPKVTITGALTFSGALTFLGSESHYSDSLQLSNCDFEENGVFSKFEADQSCDTSYAAAIQAQNLRLVQIFNCSFVGNQMRAQSNSERQLYSGGNCQGGAVGILAEEAVIVNCMFARNFAFGGNGYEGGVAEGGALFIQVTSSLSVENCVMNENSAVGGDASKLGGPGKGGAIQSSMVYPNMGHARFVGSLFSNNVAAAGKSSDPFAQDQGLSPVSGVSAAGGALFLQGGYASLDNCEFFSNKCHGGSTSVIFGIFNSLFTPQGGTAAGGALFADFLRQFNASDVIFQKNACTGGDGAVGGSGIGGAVMMLLNQNNPRVTFQDCYFRHNLASSGSDGQDGKFKVAQGGALFLSKETGKEGPARTDIVNCDFYNNSVVGSGSDADGSLRSLGRSGGGAIVLIGFVETVVLASEFHGNSVFMQESFISTETFGGAVLASTSFCIFDQCSFTNNSLLGEQRGQGSVGMAYGGALACFNDCRLRSTVLEDNYIGSVCKLGKGGAMYVNGNFSITNVTFNGNGQAVQFVGGSHEPISGKLEGGGIFIDFLNQTSYNLCNSSFSSNNASDGGALFLSWNENGTPSCNIKDVMIQNNVALRGGGGVYLSSNDVCASNSLEIVQCVRPKVQNLLYVDNSAAFGKNTSSLPCSIDSVSNILTVVPGTAYPIALILRDVFDELVIDVSYSVIADFDGSAPNFDSGVSQDTIAVNEQTGLYHIKNAMFVGVVGVSQSVSFSANATRFQTSFVTTLEYTISYCLPGQIYDGTTCVDCVGLTYNFNGSACVSCPSQSDSTDCLTTNYSHEEEREITIHEGFRPNQYSDPVQLLACPVVEACIELTCQVGSGTDFSWEVACLPECEEGYSDRLCSKCACEQTSGCWYRNNEDECLPCRASSVGVIVTMLFILAIAIIVFLVFVKSNIIMILVEFALVTLCAILGIAEWWVVALSSLVILVNLVTDANIPEGLISNFVSYFLVTGSIASPEAWPKWVRGSLESFTIFNSNTSSLSCIFPSVFSNPVYTWLFNMVMPLLLGLAIAFLSLGRQGILLVRSRCSSSVSSMKKHPVREDNELVQTSSLFQKISLNIVPARESHGRRETDDLSLQETPTEFSAEWNNIHDGTRELEIKPLLSDADEGSREGDAGVGEDEWNEEGADVREDEQKEEESVPCWHAVVRPILFLLFAFYYGKRSSLIMRIPSYL